jgi:hypothetical protein
LKRIFTVKTPRRLPFHPAYFALLIVMVATLTACLGNPAPTAQPNAAPQSAAATLPAATLLAATLPAPTATVAPASPTLQLPTPAPLAADDVIKAVKAAWAAADKAGPRRLKQVTYKGDQAITTIDAESVPPDQFHQIVTMNGQVIAEQYIDGGAIYVKAPNTEGWKKTPASAAEVGAVIGGLAQTLVGDITYSDAKVLGPETVNGEPATVYSYATQLKGFPDKTSYKLWVSTAAGLPIRQEKVTTRLRLVMDITYDAKLTVSLPAEVAAAPTANP